MVTLFSVGRHLRRIGSFMMLRAPLRVKSKGRMIVPTFRRSARLAVYFLMGWTALVMLAGCFGPRGLTEITEYPYPLTYQDDSTARFSSGDGNVFIEVRRAPATRPLEHLAVHYASLFPGGEIIKPGDTEDYLTIDGKTAYKVIFRTKYIRKRKRVEENSNRELPEIPPGWTRAQMTDPVSGDTVPVLHGPVIPQQKILYLVQAGPYIYYILMTAEGDAIKPATEKLDQFVRNGIKFH
jgi:hypothetical protein